MITRVFPFLRWFNKFRITDLRADFFAGLNVALVLIPQSMAYAQLAGLPVVYGLYASFLPPMLAAMFGSSHQLATGPVAVVSLMTAAALEPLATQGGQAYIAYAILLALAVGVFQFLLGVFRLGVIVNFLSHPVVNGFTNAAALIIASSQLSKIFGVSVDNAEHHYETIYHVIQSACSFTHWPTFAFAVFAFVIMYSLKRTAPKLPNVLIAVTVTTILAWAVGFQQNDNVDLAAMEAESVKKLIANFNQAIDEVNQYSEERTRLAAEIRTAVETHGKNSSETIDLRHDESLLNMKIANSKDRCILYRKMLRSLFFKAVVDTNGQKRFYSAEQVPVGQTTDGRIWRLKVGNRALNTANLLMVGGGEVVGDIPKGLPGIRIPQFNLLILIQLFPMAAIISLLGFMEAISIAKAMAAKTGQRLDPNQELIGQGIANIFGSFGQSYPVSGSFSRSAVNIQAGALTGLSSVFTSCLVVLVLVFFTPLLYYLPQAVLASVIMMAVIGLVDVKSFVHSWKVQKHDGIISIVTFLMTLAFAPHLEKGILIGVAMSLAVALYQHMRPELALLAKHPDGSYRNAMHWNLQLCKYIAVIRFNGSVFFANSRYLEDKILEQASVMPDLKHVLIVGNAINELDASGEEMLSKLMDRLHEAGYDVSFSGLNDHVVEVMKRTPLYLKIGEDHMFRSVQRALQVIHAKAHEYSTERFCPLLQASFKEFKPLAVSQEAKLRQDILQGPDSGKNKPDQ
ncbi:MAG: SulP family inorganic anion transporter [Candidatus Omnitrophota bacterium]|jgi:MFS superfamily sulfate permease-like transporter|nr:MAG: SulP family inorganic anion transporter [Candidatus Omnitrophota bacterium]